MGQLGRVPRGVQVYQLPTRPPLGSVKQEKPEPGKPNNGHGAGQATSAQVSKHKELVSQRLCGHPSVLICDILVTCDQGANVSMIGCVTEINIVLSRNQEESFCGTIVVLSEQSVNHCTTDPGSGSGEPSVSCS